MDMEVLFVLQYRFFVINLYFLRRVSNNAVLGPPLGEERAWKVLERP